MYDVGPVLVFGKLMNFIYISSISLTMRPSWTRLLSSTGSMEFSSSKIKQGVKEQIRNRLKKEINMLNQEIKNINLRNTFK